MDDKEVYKIIGLNIRVSRAKKQLTQDELAELVGVHEKYIGKIESGKQNITIKTLNRLANALKTDIAQFLTEIK